MRQGNRIKSLLGLILGAYLLFSAPVSRADFQFSFTIDTSSLITTTGSVEFTLNPATNAGPATATISNFVTDGTLIGTPTYVGDSSGSLTPGNYLTINNTATMNQVTQSITFGNSISFILDLNIPNPGSGPTSTFFLTMYDSNGDPFQSIFPGFVDPAVIIQVDSKGKPNTIVSGDGPTVTQVPEPKSLCLMALGFGCCLFGLAWRKRFFMAKEVSMS